MFKLKKKKLSEPITRREAQMANRKFDSGFPPPNYRPTPINCLCAVISDTEQELDIVSTSSLEAEMGQKHGRQSNSYRLNHNTLEEKPSLYRQNTVPAVSSNILSEPLNHKLLPPATAQTDIGNHSIILPEPSPEKVNLAEYSTESDKPENALDLTAPASDALLKNRKNAWVQLAGHPGSFAPAGPHTIWKKRLTKENNETVAYQALMNDKSVKDVVPKFYREVEYNGDIFIEIEDLLQHFSDPSIMDIKMGTRTFLESEVKNAVLRKDLYEKMVKLDPNEPTDEEHDQKAITKLRYMQFREKGSSTADMGFRIEAIRYSETHMLRDRNLLSSNTPMISGEPPNLELKKIKSLDEVSQTIAKFIAFKPDVHKKLLNRLEEIRDKFESSTYFKNHEIIGSSLLVLWDKQGTVNVWMIDFAKTLRIEGKILNHRSPWEVGSHETGYLKGLDNLCEVLAKMNLSPASQEESCSTKPNIPCIVPPTDDSEGSKFEKMGEET